MEAEVAGDEITQGVIDHFAFRIKKLGIEMQEHIAALNFHGLGNISRGMAVGPLLSARRTVINAEGLAEPGCPTA